MQGCAQYTGGRTPNDRGDAARSRAATDRAAGRGRPALDTLHAHAADLEDMPLADRRSQKRGLLLLRRHLGAGAAVLRLSSRGRISRAVATKVTETKPTRIERVPLRDAAARRASRLRQQNTLGAPRTRTWFGPGSRSISSVIGGSSSSVLGTALHPCVAHRNDQPSPNFGQSAERPSLTGVTIFWPAP
jgi:hypothetical protein